jgi:hypothetical protein
VNQITAISPSPQRQLRKICKTIWKSCKTFVKSSAKSSASVGNGVTVAQQTLTLFVLVRIQVPQPINKLLKYLDFMKNGPAPGAVSMSRSCCNLLPTITMT